MGLAGRQILNALACRIIDAQSIIQIFLPILPLLMMTDMLYIERGTPGELWKSIKFISTTGLLTFFGKPDTTFSLDLNLSKDSFNFI